MTRQSDSPCSATLTSSPSPDKRVRYGLGMLLGVADFEQEQAWVLEQDRSHARTLHGCGVVGGLGVAVTGTALKVAPGMAIDGFGRVINVCGDQCADLNAWLLVPEHHKLIGAPGASPSKWRMPATAASLYCSGFSDSSLWVTMPPSGRRATISVKVPPRSIQNCQRGEE